jgi:hypothetical protein
MIRYLKVQGRLAATGTAQSHGAPLWTSTFEYLRFETPESGSKHLQEVIVPSSVQALMELGDRGEFELMFVPYPKPFGTYERCFLTGVCTERGKVDAMPEVRKWISASKGAALNFFWLGLILMPGFGIGLLFWICALRLLLIKQPLT